jgi:hypothetical protein
MRTGSFIVFCFWFGLTALMLSGCVTYDRCVTKYGRTQDQVRIPVELMVPRSEIAVKLTLSQIPLLVAGKVLEVKSPDNRAVIRYWKDKYEEAINFMAVCDTVYVRDTLYVDPPRVFDPPVTRVQQAWDAWKGFSAIAMLISVLFIILMIIKYYRK